MNAVKFVARADVERVEKKLKDSIYEKTPPNTNTRRTAELAFKASTRMDPVASTLMSLSKLSSALACMYAPTVMFQSALAMERSLT